MSKIKVNFIRKTMLNLSKWKGRETKMLWNRLENQWAHQLNITGIYQDLDQFFDNAQSFIGEGLKLKNQRFLELDISIDFPNHILSNHLFRLNIKFQVIFEFLLFDILNVFQK